MREREKQRRSGRRPPGENMCIQIKIEIKEDERASKRGGKGKQWGEVHRLEMSLCAGGDKILKHTKKATATTAAAIAIPREHSGVHSGTWISK